MDNLRDLLGNMRMDKVSNAWINKLCRVTKVVGERIDECVLRWLGYVERMKKDRIAKRTYVEEYVSNRLLGRPQKRRIDNAKDFLKK